LFIKPDNQYLCGLSGLFPRFTVVVWTFVHTISLCRQNQTQSVFLHASIKWGSQRILLCSEQLITVISWWF